MALTPTLTNSSNLKQVNRNVHMSRGICWTWSECFLDNVNKQFHECVHTGSHRFNLIISLGNILTNFVQFHGLLYGYNRIIRVNPWLKISRTYPRWSKCCFQTNCGHRFSLKLPLDVNPIIPLALTPARFSELVEFAWWGGFKALPFISDLGGNAQHCSSIMLPW